MIFLLLMLIACGPGVTSPEAEEYGALAFGDQTLPDAWVGISYRHMLTAEGGVPPISWSIDRGRLPDGLRLKYDGRITGTPTEPGVYEIFVAATDAENNRKFSEVSLPVRFEPTSIGCGDVLEGSFDGSNGGLDWDRFGTYRWLQIQLPDPAVTRIEAVMRGDGSALGFIPEAGEPPGSHNLADGYVQTTLDGATTSVTVDLSTEPSLTSFRTDGLPISMLLVGNGVRDWSMEIVCTKAPIFERLWTLPVEQGEPVAIDYDILGDQSTVRIWTDDELPSWVSLNEQGLLEGIAEEPGGWDFTIKAEDDEGRVREEETMFGVFDVTDIPCNTPTLLQTEQGWYEEPFTGPYDPRGYEVFRLPFDTQIGDIQIELAGDTDSYLGLVSPDPYYRFYGSAEYDYGSTAQISLNATSYPRWTNYRGDGEALFVAAPLNDGLGLDANGQLILSVTCDRGPRTDRAALPVLEPNQNTLVELEGIGGTPPYRWSAQGLPPGVSVGTSLRALAQEEGIWDVALTIEDSEGLSHTQDYRLIVGDELACEDAEPMPCDVDTLSGTFERSYYAEPVFTEKSTRTFCIVTRDVASLYAELEHRRDAEGYLSLSDPGADMTSFLYQNDRALMRFGDEEQTVQVAIGESGWPSILDYDRMPVFVSIQAYDPGNWIFSSRCY